MPATIIDRTSKPARRFRNVSIQSELSRTPSFDMGDIRRFVAKCEGIPDEAHVRIEHSNFEWNPMFNFVEMSVMTEVDDEG